MQTLSRRTVYLLLAFVMLIWSGNSIVARAMRADVPPFTLAFLRWGGAALIALPLARRRIVADWPVVRRHWPAILLLGVIGVGSFNAFMYSGLQYTTAANTLLVQAAIPALVLLFDRIFFGTKPRIAQIAGCALAAAGVAIIILRADPAAIRAMRFNIGDLLVLVAIMLWSLYTVLLRLKPPIDGLSFMALTILIGALCMAPFSIHELQSRAVHLSLPVAAGIAYVILFPSILGYFLYNGAVEAIGAGDAGHVVNLQPLFGALLAALILGEPIHGYHFAGMALILVGIGIPLLWPGDRAEPGPEVAG
ncbi:DMT family transporter [Sphingobium nicotianae]|uniref:DMT family transporter n=1 Tax=Sphingobium nicotianae TaxID=2782607 RepID=UPI002032D569|nr:DMT family transporter [Sphingobium nicotianae]